MKELENIKTNPTLLEKLYKMAKTEMTDEQLKQQIISWVHGQTGITKDKVKETLE